MDRFVTETSDQYSLLDRETGELLEYRRTRRVTMEEFIMIFFSSFPELFSLQGVHLKILMCCWKSSSYNEECESEGNILHNNATFKNFCRQNGLDISDAMIDNGVSTLCKKGLLIKKCRGEYLLNPEYFFKGRLSDRSRLQLNILVDPLASDPEHTERH